MKPWPQIVIFIAALIIFFDELLKKTALRSFPNETEITGNKILEFAVHKNLGIAFDLPIWLPLVVFLTIIIITGLIATAVRNKNKQPWLSVSVLIIACGAIGNLIDRLVYGFTVDYLIIPATGSAFNLSDLVIITGLILLIFHRHKK